MNHEIIQINRISHECSCFIEFIKQVREKRYNVRLAEHFISLFCNKFNKFNNTGARMLDSIYHLTLKLHFHSIYKSHFWLDNVKVLPSFTQLYNGRHYVMLPNQ